MPEPKRARNPIHVYHVGRLQSIREAEHWEKTNLSGIKKTESNVWENKRHEFKSFWSSNPKSETTGRKQTDGDTSKPNPLIRKTMTMNLNRAGVQTRTQSTVEHYLKRAHQLLARIADEMQLPEDAYPPPDEVVRYMEQRAHQWKWATFLQYQASLVYRYAREYEKSGDPLFAKTAQALRVLSHKTCQPAHVIGHTSSRKRKGIRNAISRRWLRACRIPNRTVTMQSAPRSGWQQRR